MKTFVASDTHFGHQNILKFCPNTRQFRDVHHMNAMMIKEWNETVGPDDLVYHLGDFAFLKPESAIATARMLHGRKILIEGNHDDKLLREPGFRACFEEVHKYHEIVVDGNHVVMFHYPIAEWNKCHRGSVQIHGHVHGKDVGMSKFRVRDASMDSRGTVVTEMSTIVRDAMRGEIFQHH